MKIATIIVRVLIGLLLLVVSIGYFFHLFPEPVTTGDFKAFNLGLVASAYLIPLAKIIELLCGIAFLSNRFVTLANLMILPVTINILFINFFMQPDGLPTAIVLFLGNLFLIYAYWRNYKSVFAVK